MHRQGIRIGVRRFPQSGKGRERGGAHSLCAKIAGVGTKASSERNGRARVGVNERQPRHTLAQGRGEACIVSRETG